MESSVLNTEWRFVKLAKYPNRLICDDGNVYNAFGRKLNLKPSRGGYMRVRMYKKGEEFYTWVHRMVGYAFLGDCDGCDIHHKDKNIKNNHYLNLKKMTEEEHVNEHRNARNN